MSYFPTKTGEEVYRRTYSRVKPNGERETWPETVERVVDGNLALVNHRHEQARERQQLIDMMTEFKILPAGRHLWASGVKGRQYLMNCWVSGWTENPTDHFEFTFLRLMEGGGVGANYSNRFLAGYEPLTGNYTVHIVCDPGHPDYEKMRDAGLLSEEFSHEWGGAFRVEDSREGWAAALVDLISTYYRGDVQHADRVYDVSLVRKAGAPLKTFGGIASGPQPLGEMLQQVAKVLNSTEPFPHRLTGMMAMEIDHAIAQCVVAGGNRRSARMSIMHWADPEISEFLRCKEDTSDHWTTNISVEVDAEFWNRLQDQQPDADFILRWITEGMLTNGEPGIWDSSLSNHGEPNAVTCTNPCGEVILEPWEPCNLGHVNLGAFVKEDGSVDWLGLREAHRLMTRFLIRATYGDVNDPKSREVLDRNRRIGVGHFGVAAFLALRGIEYDRPTRLAGTLRDLAIRVEMSASEYCHDLRIPVPVKTRTVAPTGSIAKLPGTTEGIHPIFARHFIRRIRFSTIDPDQVATLYNYQEQGYKVEKDLYAENTAVVEIPTEDSLYAEVKRRHGSYVADEVVLSADDLTLEDLLRMQQIYQTYWADNAVSFTANVDPKRYRVEKVAETIVRFGGSLKGFTIFPEMSRPQSPYERITEDEYRASLIREVADSVDTECSSGACPIR